MVTAYTGKSLPVSGRGDKVLYISTVTQHAKGIPRYDKLTVLRTLDHLIKFGAHEIDLPAKRTFVEVAVPGFHGEPFGNIPCIVIVTCRAGEAVNITFYFRKGIHCTHRVSNLMTQRSDGTL